MVKSGLRKEITDPSFTNQGKRDSIHPVKEKRQLRDSTHSGMLEGKKYGNPANRVQTKQKQNLNQNAPLPYFVLL